MKGREGDKTKEQVMHNTTVHHLLTDDQRVPEPQSPSRSWLTPPGLYSEHDVLWNIVLATLVTCRSQAPSQPFVYLITCMRH